MLPAPASHSDPRSPSTGGATPLLREQVLLSSPQSNFSVHTSAGLSPRSASAVATASTMARGPQT